MQALTFITSHPKKAAEIGHHLDYPVTHHMLDLPEIQSLDPKEVVIAKAQEAYRQLGRPVLVEDYSLRFDALGKLPGPLIKWVLQELRPEGVCALLDGYANRRACAQNYFALCDAAGVHVFAGEMLGTVADVPRGGHGYGTDGIFIPDGQRKTWAEMTPAEHAAYSLRRVGLKKLQAYLQP